MNIFFTKQQKEKQKRMKNEHKKQNLKEKLLIPLLNTSHIDTKTSENNIYYCILSGV